jgi:hypothetical protein
MGIDIRKKDIVMNLLKGDETAPQVDVSVDNYSKVENMKLNELILKADELTIEEFYALVDLLGKLLSKIRK